MQADSTPAQLAKRFTPFEQIAAQWAKNRRHVPAKYNAFMERLSAIVATACMKIGLLAYEMSSTEARMDSLYRILQARARDGRFLMNEARVFERLIFDIDELIKDYEVEFRREHTDEADKIAVLVRDIRRQIKAVLDKHRQPLSGFWFGADSAEIQELVDSIAARVREIAKLSGERLVESKLTADASKKIENSLRYMDDILARWLMQLSSGGLIASAQLGEIGARLARLRKILDKHVRAHPDPVAAPAPIEPTLSYDAHPIRRLPLDGLAVGQCVALEPVRGNYERDTDIRPRFTDFGICNTRATEVDFFNLSGRSATRKPYVFAGIYYKEDTRAANYLTDQVFWVYRSATHKRSGTEMEPSRYSQDNTIEFVDIDLTLRGRSALSLAGKGPLQFMEYVDSPLDTPFFLVYSKYNNDDDAERPTVTLCALAINAEMDNAQLVPVVDKMFISRVGQRPIVSVAHTADDADVYNILISLEDHIIAGRRTVTVYQAALRGPRMGMDPPRIMVYNSMKSVDHHIRLYVDSAARVMLFNHTGQTLYVFELHHTQKAPTQIAALAIEYARATEYMSVTDAGRIFVRMSKPEYCELVDSQRPEFEPLAEEKEARLAKIRQENAGGISGWHKFFRGDEAQ